MKPFPQQLEDAAQDQTAFCHCAGFTCSGCEENTMKLFKRGAHFALRSELVRELVLSIDYLLKNPKRRDLCEFADKARTKYSDAIKEIEK